MIGSHLHILSRPVNPYPRILKKSKNREMSKRLFWKKNPTTILAEKRPGFFPRNNAYSFPKILFFFKKRHQNNRNFANWIIFLETKLLDVLKRAWFFPKNDASSFPVFLELMTFITWFLTLMTSRDLCHVIYNWTDWCCFRITWRHKL